MKPRKQKKPEVPARCTQCKRRNWNDTPLCEECLLDKLAELRPIQKKEVARIQTLTSFRGYWVRPHKETYIRRKIAARWR